MGHGASSRWPSPPTPTSRPRPSATSWPPSSRTPTTHLRYRLAVFYKKAGLKVRALLHLRVVVGRDPNHAAAIRDLRELQTD